MTAAARRAARPDQDVESRRDATTTWADTVPDGPAATAAYFALLAEELDTTEDDIAFRYRLLEASAASGADLAGEPDTRAGRFILRDGDTGLVGTPNTPAACRAVADLETLAADRRREKRAHLEQVEEDGTRWVRYSNDRYSEILRAVHYDQENGELTVHLADKRTATSSDALHTSTYTYKDVHPSIVRHLVSARSMGRFYSYVFSRKADGSSLTGETLKNYTFLAHYSNFMWPTRRGTTGPVPAPKTLGVAKRSITGR
jgi:hypothetical protein